MHEDCFCADLYLAVQMRCRNGGDEKLGSVCACRFYLRVTTSFSDNNKPGPEFAIERRKGLSCFFSKFSSSNFSPYMLSPPVPLALVKSPPWSIKALITRWKIEPAMTHETRWLREERIACLTFVMQRLSSLASAFFPCA